MISGESKKRNTAYFKLIIITYSCIDKALSLLPNIIPSLKQLVRVAIDLVWLTSRANILIFVSIFWRELLLIHRWIFSEMYFQLCGILVRLKFIIVYWLLIHFIIRHLQFSALNSESLYWMQAIAARRLSQGTTLRGGNSPYIKFRYVPVFFQHNVRK